MEGEARNLRRYPFAGDQREDDSCCKGEVANQIVNEDGRIDQKAGHDKENWDEKGVCQKIQRVLSWLVITRGVKRETGKKCADDSWQVDNLCEQTSHNHEGKHENEVGVVVIFK